MNVILIVADTLRADHLGSYGNGWIRTPNLDRLAREGVRFARAYPEALATVPVRRAIHTGKRTFPCRDWFPRKGDYVRTPGWQPLVQGEGRATREYVTCIFRDYVWMRDAEHSLIARRDGTDVQLFDLVGDPGQRRDVASERADVVARLFERILADGGGAIPDYAHLLSPKPGAWYQV